MLASEKYFVTDGHWFGECASPALAWVTVSPTLDRHVGVLILPPLAYEYLTCHLTLRTLAERFAADGYTVMRLDCHGVGDAAGDSWSERLLELWRQQVAAAVEQLRQMGARSIVLVGVRFSATLILSMAESLGVQAIIAWMPVVSGRRYVRELRLMSANMPKEHPAGSGCIVAGVVLTEAFLQEIGNLSLQNVSAPAAHVCIVDRIDAPGVSDFADSLRGRTASVAYAATTGAETVLEVSTEEAGAAVEVIESIQSWIRTVSVGEISRRVRIPQLVDSATWRTEWGDISERILSLTEMGLVAVETRSSKPASDITIVFLNSGSEKHIGPGRAWVEYARALAQLGHVSIRVDFRGWGESPDNGFSPGRPYDRHAVADTSKIVDSLQQKGHRNIVLVGVCAGAWVALESCSELSVQGIVAFNPQLYWQFGDPVPASMAKARVWYEEISRQQSSWVERSARTRQWLCEISKLPYPVDFWFEAGDPGLAHVRKHLPEVASNEGQEARGLSVMEWRHLDHSMHRHWARHEAIDAINHLVKRMQKRTGSDAGHE